MMEFTGWLERKARMFSSEEHTHFSDISPRMARLIWQDQEAGLDWLEKSIIVPQNKRNAANGMCRGLYAWVDAEIFTVPLSADGTDPPTHYGCHWYISPSCWDAIDQVEHLPGAAVYDGDFGSAIAASGLQRIVEPLGG